MTAQVVDGSDITRYDVGDRLGAALEVLRVAAPVYLRWLHAGWAADGEPGLEPLIAAFGTAPAPSAAEEFATETALAALEADRTSVLARIALALGLGPADQLVVAAAHWVEVDLHVATVFGCVHDDGARRWASLGALGAILGPLGLRVPVGLDRRHPLVAGGLLYEAIDRTEPVRLTPTARALLCDRALPTLPRQNDLPGRLSPLVDRLAAHLARPDAGPVAVRGPRGVGRRALAIEGVLAAGRLPVPGDRPTPELVLLSAVGTVPVIEPVEPSDGRAADTFAREAAPARVVIVLDPDAPIPPEARLVIDVRRPDVAERATRWTDQLGRHGAEIDSQGVALLASRFRLHDADIDAVVERAAADAASHTSLLDLTIAWRTARGFPRHSLDSVAELVTPEVTLDDLIVSPDTAALLDGVVHHVTLQHQVMEAWGFRARLPRGAGVAALFGGPPGTGKTMAAEAIAAELEQDLWRVDLSCVVSKYIGETEKNLAAAFDGAEAAGAVLFFDEADSLFGKRTEVKEAHDRYANLEVNYLLQRVETFTGLVVLATNREQAIDSAFLRRLRFMVRFESPDAEARAQLWRRAFPPAALAGELPWDTLAELELTGGNIQSVSIHAAFGAAAAGRPVGIADVLAALPREFTKLGRAWRGVPGIEAKQ